jgi:hypothetical protein
VSNQLLLSNGTTRKLLANIPIRKYKKSDGLGKPDSEKKKERKLPLFYTEPIFKAKRHDLF